MKLYKLFGRLALTSAVLCAVSCDCGVPTMLVGMFALSAVVCFTLWWYLMEKHAQQEAQHEINERRKGA